MAKKSENLPERITPSSSVPSYLQEFAADVAETKAAMGEYIIMPRMKIIQDLSGVELKAFAPAGSIILSPANVLVAKKLDEMVSESFDFIALFFYTEFCKWRDLNDKSGDTIMERSFDKSGKLAVLSRDKNKRFEAYGELNPQTKQPKFNFRYVEHLNFMGQILGDHPLANQPCAISFSRGEFMTGCNFITASVMRKTPIWSQIWSFRSKYKVVGQNKWWGYAYDPATEPNITQDMVATYRDQNQSLKEAFEQKRLSVDHSEQDVDLEPSAGSKF